MLRSVYVRNFKSITELSLKLEYDQRKAPNGYAQMPILPFVETAGLRLVPIMALYGPNAAGKTTILQAIDTLIFFARGQDGFPRYFFDPYLLKGNTNPTTKIEIEWALDEGIWNYSAEVSENFILEEKLTLNGLTIFGIREGCLLLDIENGSEVVNDRIRIQCIDAKTKQQVRSIFSVIVNSFPGFDERINKAFRYLTEKVNYFNADIPPWHGVKILSKTFNLRDQESRESAALQLITEFLRKLDVRIKRIEVEKTKQTLDSLPSSIQSYLSQILPHSNNAQFDRIEFNTIHLSESGEEVAFNFRQESQGTQKLFSLIAFLLTAVRKGGIAIIDELDKSLHPTLLPELIKLFQLREFNTQESQLIFTIHNTELLESGQLTVSEIGLVNQRGYNGTKIRRLSEFEDSRNVNNFRKRYLTGFYDAIPSPFI